MKRSRSARRHSEETAEPGKLLGFVFFFNQSHVMERHSSWISAFKEGLTSLAKLASSEPAGLELDLEPVFYLSCLLCPSSSSPTRPAFSPVSGSPGLGPPSGSVGDLAQLLPARRAWGFSECRPPPLLPGPLSFLLPSLPSAGFLSVREAGCLGRGQVPHQLSCQV